jgi:FixJ family two-component response regulator
MIGGESMTGGESRIVGEPMIGVVDDELSVRRSLDRLLRAYGFRVRTFASADEFLDQPEAAEPPACLIVDLRMAGKTGLDLVDALRARGTDIPVIMMTGHGEVSMADRAGKAAAVEFLVKPVDSEVLLQAIAKAIG